MEESKENTKNGLAHVVKANKKVWVSCVVLWQFPWNVNKGVYQQRKCQKGIRSCDN
jgi:PIN domain nuclease of toxin-antitoxin system